MPREKIYGALIILASIALLIYMTIAYANILLSNGIQPVYPYFGELFFGPWVYLILPIMIGEIVILGILMFTGWEKITQSSISTLKRTKKNNKKYE